MVARPTIPSLIIRRTMMMTRDDRPKSDNDFTDSDLVGSWPDS